MVRLLRKKAGRGGGGGGGCNKLSEEVGGILLGLQQAWKSGSRPGEIRGMPGNQTASLKIRQKVLKPGSRPRNQAAGL